MARVSRFVIVLLLLLGSSQVLGAEPLKVGLAGAEPFIIRGEKPDGLTVEIWEELADLNGFSYEYLTFPTVTDALAALEAEEIDVAIGPITITAERAERVDFTQPYYRAHLGILSPVKQQPWYNVLGLFLSFGFLKALGVLLFILALVGSLVSLAERKANPEEFPSGARGLAEGMWFAIVTMTTVGYGDKAPKTGAGRLLTSVWMLIATISFSTLTAGIATSFTLANLQNVEITSPEMLAYRSVGVVAGSTGAEIASNFQAHTVPKQNLEEAVELLLEEKVQAVVFDHPALVYYLQKHPTDKLRLAESHFQKQDYGLALQRGTQLRLPLNIALLELQEQGRLKELEESWLSQLQNESKE